MEKSSFKLLTLLAFSVLSVSLKAQNLNNITDVSGKPLFETKYTDVQGTPFLTDYWANGMVKLDNGKTYTDIKLRYDLVEDQLLFRNKDGQSLAFVDGVQEFKLDLAGDEQKSLYFKNGFKPVDGATEKTYYQVLSGGETTLLKRTSKHVLESKAYNSATTTKTFDEVSSLYVIKDGQPIKLKKDKKSVLAAFDGYTAQLDAFIKDNKLNLKSDQDLVKLAEFYNSQK